MAGLCHPNPVQLFQGMWASGIVLNCNVYWPCTNGCTYCYVQLNRKAYRYKEGGTEPRKAFSALCNLLNRAHGPAYDETDALQYFLHNRYPMCLSNNSDPFCDLEAEHGHTLQYLEVLAEYQAPVQLLTKAQGWSKLDKDAYLSVLKRFEKLWVSVSLTTEDLACHEKWEPHGALPEDKWHFVRDLTEAGIDVAVHCVPLIPTDAFPSGAWDDPETYRPFIECAAESGCYGIFMGTLGFDISKNRGADAEIMAWVHANEWCRGQLDRPWRLFSVDVEIGQVLAQIWYDLPKEYGMRGAVSRLYASTVLEPGNVDGLAVPPEWVDRSTSWLHASHLLRSVQNEHGVPVISDTGSIADYLTRGTPLEGPLFRWKSWQSCVPHRFHDADYRHALASMPEEVTAADVIRFQHNQLCRWGDAIWGDLATAPITQGGGNQVLNERNDYYVSYDYTDPRPHMAVSRAGHGWDGRDLEELLAQGAVDHNGEVVPRSTE